MLFPLSNIYRKIEKQSRLFNKQHVHLYPTPKVKQIFEKIDVNDLSELNKKLSELFNKNELKISTDTTVYYPEKFANCKKISIENNRLMRNGDKLGENKTYIFVLSEKDELFATQKQRQGKYGRIHHSTLVRGESVQTAGMLTINRLKNGNLSISITNESGHYKPTPDSLNKIVEWLKTHGLKFTCQSDQMKTTAFGNVRNIVLETQKNTHSDTKQP